MSILLIRTYWKDFLGELSIDCDSLSIGEEE